MSLINNMKKQNILDKYKEYKDNYIYYYSFCSKYETIKNLLEIGIILLGVGGTITPMIFLLFFNNDEKLITGIISAVSSIQAFISVILSKIINGYLIEKQRVKRDINKEYSDKIFLFFF